MKSVSHLPTNVHTYLQGLADLKLFFTARRYASAVYAMALCLSVSLSKVGVILKRLNIGSRKQHDSIAEGI